MKQITWISIVLLFSCSVKKEFNKEEILRNIKSVADYELDHPSKHDFDLSKDYVNGWVPSTFYICLIPLYEVSREERYLEEVKKWGDGFEWQCAPKLHNADDIACGQVFLDMYRYDKSAYYISNLVSRMDSVINSAKPGREEWYWCDALFMAPPTYIMASKILEDSKYKDFTKEMYWDVYNYLYDSTESLFYRDNRFFERKSPNGEKVFWGRGNGWVIAGLARLIPYLEKEEQEPFIDLFLKMAQRIAGLQQPDGLWRSNLLDPNHFPVKETSSTAFFVYSLAWGINQGLLDEGTYLPIVKKGWFGMTDCINNETGMLGYVQPIGAAPDSTSASTTMSYGAGAFVLAGIEILKLIGDPNQATVISMKD